MPMASTAYLTVERRQEAKKREAMGKIAPVAHNGPPPTQISVEPKKEFCFLQSKVRALYDSPETQFTVAFLIFLNFVSEAVNAQILPVEGSSEYFLFLIFEFIFNISFTIELAWNMYGSWFFKFWDSGWNWFDFIIVIISLLAMLLPGIPGISVLRLFRAFRVFRLFKRIKSLKKIIEGVLGALPGVSQAFMVLGILMGIWSVIAVEFFRDHMPWEFGNFIRAMYTLFQIMTMDSWSSGIARYLIFDKHLPMASIFFITYIFIAGIVMTNVVVAILLDKYLEAIDKDKQEEQEASDAAAAAEEDGMDEDMTQPEVEIYVYNDGLMKPLRALTWHKFRELQTFLEDAAKPDPKKDDDSDSEDESSDESDGGIQRAPKEMHVGGSTFYRDTKSSRDVFYWETSTVLRWLRFIGFQEYQTKFKNEGIDGQTLTQLNEIDLINLGMKLLRRKHFMTALYELLSDSEFPKRDEAKNFQDLNSIKPSNAIRRHNNYRHKKPQHQIGGSVQPVEPDEYMYFKYNKPDTNSRIPQQSSTPKGSVQMTAVRRHPQSANQDQSWSHGSEIISE